MKIRQLAAVSAITVAAVGLAAGTAAAAPAPAPAPPAHSSTQSADRINYTAQNNGSNAIITTDAGSLAVSNGQFQIKAANGTVVAGIPLELRLDDISMPIDAKVQGNTATLTPDTTRAVYKPVVGLPFQDTAPWKTPYEREQAAWQRMTTTITSGAAIGAMVGAVGASVAGCVAGGALGFTGGLAFLLAGAVPGALIGCLAGAAAFAPIGTLTGSIFVTAPIAIAAAIQYFSTINAPFTPATPAPAPAAPAAK